MPVVVEPRLTMPGRQTIVGPIGANGQQHGKKETTEKKTRPKQPSFAIRTVVQEPQTSIGNGMVPPPLFFRNIITGDTVGDVLKALAGMAFEALTIFTPLRKWETINPFDPYPFGDIEIDSGVPIS